MKKGIIVTSAGTTHEDTRRLCIEPIEDLIKNEFKDYLVLRAFTSRIVISRLKENANYPVNNPTQALEQMKSKGIKNIYIQPLLIIEGHGYNKTIKEVKTFSKENMDLNIRMGQALLSNDQDYKNTIRALKIADFNKDEGLILMGHGTNHKADIAYEKMQKMLRDKGYKNVFIGTMEGARTIEDIVYELKIMNINKVALKPFMLVAGDHAKNDMASDKEDSWKTILGKNGIEVSIEMKGLGENKNIQEIFLDHLSNM